jgi:hypothetical protein
MDDGSVGCVMWDAVNNDISRTFLLPYICCARVSFYLSFSALRRLGRAWVDNASGAWRLSPPRFLAHRDVADRRRTPVTAPRATLQQRISPLAIAPLRVTNACRGVYRQT